MDEEVFDEKLNHSLSFCDFSCIWSGRNMLSFDYSLMST